MTNTEPDVVDLAEQAAQAVRELNHATLADHALTGPAQLDRLVAELAVMAGRIPQLLGQLDRWLTGELRAGRIRSDNDADPAHIVGNAADWLAGARHAAHDLATTLDGAHQHLAHLGATQPRQTRHTPTRRDKDLALLAAGLETGWWDDTGRPAPWPDDFFDPDSDWCTAGSDAADPPVVSAPGEPPF
jgi:hypothetical protein